MDDASIDRLLSMVPSSRVLEHATLKPETVETLVRVTYNRGILLADIHEHVLRNILLLTDDEVKVVITTVKSAALYMCGQDLQVKGRHIPNPRKRVIGEDVERHYYHLKPPNWTSLDMVASGAEGQMYHVAQVIDEMYDTNAVRANFESENARSRGHKFSSLYEKCEASGCAEMIPTAKIVPTNTRLERHAKGTPTGRLRKRIKLNSVRVEAEDKHSWRFVSHLEEQIRIFVALNTIQGSWTSVKSELQTFSSYMCFQHPQESHFPLTSARLTGFASLLDNASSGIKYIQAVKKACAVLRQPMPPSEEVKMMKAGARKFHVPGEKSFLKGGSVDVLVTQCVGRHLVQLAQLVTVSYTFQLRVQSEGIALGTSTPEEFQRGAAGVWHSHVITRDDGAVVIWLRKRKNKPLPSSIVRFCICSVWRPKVVCGVCALRLALSQQTSVGRLFPETKVTDINVLKDIGRAKELGNVTWHGFRRGRTEDVVSGLDVRTNPTASLVEIAETLGHNLRRASFFQYVHGDTASRKSVRRLCEDTDSE